MLITASARQIAKKFVRFHEEYGGWLTSEDMSLFRVDVEPAHAVTFKGIEISGCGFWCQGPVLLQTLRFLDGIGLSVYAHNSPEYIHLLVEALKFSYADRHAYYGDPKFMQVPADELLSEEYAARRRSLFDPSRASPGMPSFGETSIVPGTMAVRPTPEWREPGIDTAYICVVDKDGNSFSATPSDDRLNGPVIPGTGFVPSTRGMQSFLDPAHPSCLAPGKRPRLTPSPALLCKPGEWVMPIGSPGNDVQPQAMLQVILNLIAFGMTPRRAVEAPRFATYSFPASSDPHDFFPNRLTLEGRVSKETASRLSALGHEISWWPEWDWRAGCVPCQSRH